MSERHLSLLVAKGISKRFGGVHALADVSFDIRHGEIYGLIGPNGAGKTSLFNVLTGIYRQDAGEFVFDGEPMADLKPHEVAARGIARGERRRTSAPHGVCSRTCRHWKT